MAFDDVASPAPHVAPPAAPRRRFLSRLTLALSALAAAIVGLPWLAFVLSPVRRPEAVAWRGVGAVEQFPLGATVKVTFLNPRPLPWAGFAAENAAWVRRTGVEEFVAFSIYCTHVGCPVRWEAGAGLFMCPCHGGVFYEDGSVAAGPPPRPLPRHEVRVRDGQVEVLAERIPVPG
jgi:menaquinol-cytochrome c reductase iron-sulfur subunit